MNVDVMDSRLMSQPFNENYKIRKMAESNNNTITF